MPTRIWERERRRRCYGVQSTFKVLSSAPSLSLVLPGDWRPIANTKATNELEHFPTPHYQLLGPLLFNFLRFRNI